MLGLCLTLPLGRGHTPLSNTKALFIGFRLLTKSTLTTDSVCLSLLVFTWLFFESRTVGVSQTGAKTEFNANSHSRSFKVMHFGIAEELTTDCVSLQRKTVSKKVFELFSGCKGFTALQKTLACNLWRFLDLRFLKGFWFRIFKTVKKLAHLIPVHYRGTYSDVKTISTKPKTWIPRPRTWAPIGQGQNVGLNAKAKRPRCTRPNQTHAAKAALGFKANAKARNVDLRPWLWPRTNIRRSRVSTLPLRGMHGCHTKFHDVITDVIRPGSAIREDHLDTRLHIGEHGLKISAYSDKNYRRKRILKMWKCGQTDPQTDTSTDNKGHYSWALANQYYCHRDKCI